MIRFSRNRLSRFIRFGRDETGTATVEFVILFPIFMAVFFASFESGYMMVRNVMMERAVDLAVRDLRLGRDHVQKFDGLKKTICDNAVIVADCEDVVQIELIPVSTADFAVTMADVRCRDVESEIDPIDVTTFKLGDNNSLMLLRVCAMFRPMFPSTTYGLKLDHDGFGNYALVVTSAYVNEPNRRVTP